MATSAGDDTAAVSGEEQPRKQAVLRVEDLVKQFGATRALDGISLSIMPGEVHALVGHNGSGKSTLVKILAGYHRPDAGKVIVNGTRVRYPVSAEEMRRRGVYLMHQDIGLASSMTVLENLRIMTFQTGFASRIQWRKERAGVTQLLERFSLKISPDTPVWQLSQTERAIVGCLRAFQETVEEPERRLVVLDEPTAFLPRDDVKQLFNVVEKVAAASCAVLLVTHHIDEPFTVAEKVTVLRNGQVTASRQVSGLTETELIQLIVGGNIRSGSTTHTSDTGEELLAVKHLRGESLAGVTFTGYAGEILGLTGLPGSGYEELPYLVSGGRPVKSGSIDIEGVSYAKPSPPKSLARGIAFLPSDRQKESGVMPANVRENITLPSLSQYRNAAGWIGERREKNNVRNILESFDILPRQPEAQLTELSGGNQQKALLARWLVTDPRILLLHEPTQGVDIGSVHEILDMLRKHAAKRRLIILASNQYEDLIRVCTKVIVFRSGQISAELGSEELSTSRILTESYAQ